MSFRLPLLTERLVMRELTTADLGNHERLCGDERVVRYLYDEPMSGAEARAHLMKRIPAVLPVDGGWMNLAVESDGRYLGEVGVCLSSVVHRQCEVGYVFLPEVAGHGYATEATAAMLGIAFDLLGAHRVVARLDARNRASARVAERIGMRCEGLFRENEFVKGEWTDEEIWAVTEDEWRSARQSGRR